jgi:hypothetical protein
MKQAYVYTRTRMAAVLEKTRKNGPEIINLKPFSHKKAVKREKKPSYVYGLSQ